MKTAVQIFSESNVGQEGHSASAVIYVNTSYGGRGHLQRYVIVWFMRDMHVEIGEQGRIKNGWGKWALYLFASTILVTLMYGNRISINGA